MSTSGYARAPFDATARVVVACESLPVGPLKLVRGDEVPWRECGLSEFDLFMLWTALQIDTVNPASAPAPAPPAPPPGYTSAPPPSLARRDRRR